MASLPIEIVGVGIVFKNKRFKFYNDRVDWDDRVDFDLGWTLRNCSFGFAQPNPFALAYADLQLFPLAHAVYWIFSPAMMHFLVQLDFQWASIQSIASGTFFSPFKGGGHRSGACAQAGRVFSWNWGCRSF
jgi:hypothetical protein